MSLITWVQCSVGTATGGVREIGSGGGVVLMSRYGDALTTETK